MYKKVLIFLFTFCLGWVSSQMFHLNKKVSINIFENSLIPNKSQPAGLIHSKPNNFNYIYNAENCLQDFQIALANNDRQKVISFINFPIEVRLVGKRKQPYFKTIKSKDKFLADYDKIFDIQFKNFVAKIKPKQLLYSTSGDIFIYRSEIRMKPFYKNDSENSEVKIIKINKYSTYP